MARPTGRLRVFSPSVLLRRGAIYKGFVGGSRVWTVVGVVMFGSRFLRKALGGAEEIVTTEQLHPGHVLRLEAIPMDTREQRRRARATAPVVRRSGS